MTVSLVDAFTRHQVYLEGYKEGLTTRLDPILLDLYEDVQAVLVSLGVATLDELTRRQLSRLIAAVERLQTERNDRFRSDMMQELRDLAQADALLSRGMLEHTEGKTVEDAFTAKDGLPLLGLLALRRNRPGRARLWALVSNSPNPATGFIPRQAITGYLRFVNKNIRELITRGYANGWTLRQTMAAIFGTKGRRFRDGFMHRAKRAGASMLRTVVQHVSSVVQAGVASIFYTHYEWVSILDKFTSKICQFRDGLIYKYRKGPLPPAHYNCRSRAVPVKNGQTYASSPATFNSWLRLQPAAVVRDMGGVRKGRFRPVKALTLVQFTDKLLLIIAD